MNTLRVHPVGGLPEIRAGDDLSALILRHVSEPLVANDVVVVTSKIVSKAAGLVQVGEREALIDRATDRLVARRGQTRIVRTWHGLTMAAAGLDASNTQPGTVVALPERPDADAARLRARLIAARPQLAGRLAVLITDTAGRAWRVGQTDLAIGLAGLAPLRSYAGERDTYGNELVVTAPAIADEIAGAADLVAGKRAATPVSVVRGVDPTLFCDDDGPGAAALIREESGDLFGLGAHQAVDAATAPGTNRPRGFAELGASPSEVADRALDGHRHDALEIARRDDAATVRLRVAAKRTDAAMIEFGALTERLRILCRAYGMTVTGAQSRELPATLVIGADEPSGSA